MSLYGFDLGFETTLMEDIFNGPEWTRFLASSAADPQATPTTDTDGPSTYHLAEDKPCETVQVQTAAEVINFEAMLTLTDSDAASGTGGEMTDVAQTVCDEIREEDDNQLSSSVDVSSVQLEEIRSESDDQNTDTNPDPNESTESLEQPNMQDICQNQSDDVSETASESNMGDDDDKDPNQMDPDLSQANTNNANPHPSEITASNPEEPTTEGEVNPYEEVMMATPDTLHEGATADMLNPYLEIDTGGGDSSETEDDSPYLSSHTGVAGSLSLGEVEESAPLILPLVDSSDVKV